MILAALNDYYGRLASDSESGIAQRGYSLEKISYEIVLDKDGDIVAVNDLRVPSGKKLVPREIVVPQKSPGSANSISPKFLWDKTSYALGLTASSKRSEKEHAAFKELHETALSASDDPGLRAFLNFLNKWSHANSASIPFFAAHGEDFLDKNVVFRLDGENRFLHERSAAIAIRMSLLDDGDDAEIGRCLVSGELATLVRLHPFIRNVRGQILGGSIVSYNDDSYLSYRASLKKRATKDKQNDSSASAPISKQVAFAYTTALNHLLRRGEENRQRLEIGDATVVFWARAKDHAESTAAEDLFSEFLDPKEQDAQQTGKLHDTLEQVRQGLPLRDLDARLDDAAEIFVLGLAPNAARLSIRFWETGTLRTFAERLAAHYEDLRIEPSPWRTPPAIWRLLLASAPNRDGKAKREDVPPLLAGELTRAVLTGGRYPYSLLGALIMRLRADHDERAFGARAALIKAVLVRAQRLGQQSHHEGGIPVSLDASNTDPGYLLGRLFAVLENIQRAALGKQVNATIRDRFYGAASASPASVFPMLVRNAQHHLGRLRKDKAGFAVNLEKEIGEVFDRFGTSFPRSLGIEAQGHFAIGYYHQTQARFAGERTQHDTDDTTDSEGETA